jgi:hypothetical protein
MLRAGVYGLQADADGLFPLDDWARAFLIITQPAE